MHCVTMQAHSILIKNQQSYEFPMFRYFVVNNATTSIDSMQIDYIELILNPIKFEFIKFKSSKCVTFTLMQFN